MRVREKETGAMGEKRAERTTGESKGEPRTPMPEDREREKGSEGEGQ